MLSLPAIHQVTGARAVLVHRHPGATLTSYRRMGWSPDLEELQTVVVARRHAGLDPIPVGDLPKSGSVSEAVAMGMFWNALYQMALNDARGVPGLLVVAHQTLAAGGRQVTQELFDELSLSYSDETDAELMRESGVTDPASLHNFARNPSDVSSAWRSKLSDVEIAEIESVTEDVRNQLNTMSFGS